MIRFEWRFFPLFFVLFFYGNSDAQYFSPKNYPQQYFQWPVGARVAIAANFGELRPNHYHMGLDCKTDQTVNRPVFAAASGYIARVKIEPFGFGQSITINHPNGISTLYAHLNSFYPALAKYIEAQQYKLQQWEITIMLPENMFPVHKGDIVAYSGNTGGSQGPHLHFEIRDTKTDKVLNPLLFKFPIPDKIDPHILRLAVYDRRISTYEQSPKIYNLRKVNGVYKPAGPILVSSDKVSFAITAYDQYSGSTNQNGIYTALLYDNDNPVCGFEMDSISYDETRYLNAHIDYKTRSNGGPYLEHLSKLPGYWEGIYITDKSNGVISLADESAHEMKIVVTDADGNSSKMEFTLKRNGLSTVYNNASGPLFYPGLLNVFENDHIRFYLAGNILYDSFHFVYKEIIPTTGEPIYQLHNTSVPLHANFPLRIKAGFDIKDTGRIVMKRFAGSKEDFKKAQYEKGWYKASFRELGNFQLLIDSIPPTVTPIGFSNGMNASRISRIIFAVKDNCEDIQSFTGTLDGNWLLFSNDKAKNFIYTFDEHCSAGEHDLLITVTDLAGNITEKKYHFTR